MIATDRWRELATRRRVAFLGIGLATYLLALLASLPAAVLIDRSERITAVGGTIWHGEALLAGGSRLGWRWAPLRTLAHFAFAADFTVDGIGTQLGGQALLRRTSLRLDGVSGTGDGALLDAVVPGLGFTCTMPLTLDLRQVEVGGDDQRVSGRMMSDGGSCQPKGGAAAIAVPALAFEATRLGTVSQATLAPATQRRRTLADIRLTKDGALSLTVTRDGATTLPFTAPPAGLTIDTKL